MTQRLFVTRHLQQLIRPGQNVLISALCPDIGRMRFPVGEAVGAFLPVLAEPEPDRVGRCLPRLVLRESLRCVAGIPEHQDRLQSRERLRSEDRGRRRRRVGRSVGISFSVFDAVAYLAGRFDPVPRRVQIVPRPSRIVLQIVERAVLLRFDRDGLLKRLLVRKRCLYRQQRR